KPATATASPATARRDSPRACRDPARLGRSVPATSRTPPRGTTAPPGALAFLRAAGFATMLAMSIALERCAEMRAEMDSGRQRDEVLTRAGVTADEWVAAQREWLAKMGAELELGRFELTNRYTHAFLDQRKLAVPAPVAVAEAPLPPAAAPPPVKPPRAD